MKPETPSVETTRLNKYLAFHLGVSRREADDMIARGDVTVNTEQAIIGARVKDSDDVAVNQKPVAKKQQATYVLFHKPTGYVCSRKDQGDAPTIYALLPKEFHHLKPVGRLDKNSSGILLLTDDGDLALRMTHPKYAKRKVYEVMLDKELEPLHQQMINDYGVALDDGISKLQLERLSESSRKPWTVTMGEGRNRQIRRTFTALGYTVVRLHRTNFGEYSLDDIKPKELKKINIHPVI